VGIKTKAEKTPRSGTYSSYETGLQRME